MTFVVNVLEVEGTISVNGIDVTSEVQSVGDKVTNAGGVDSFAAGLFSSRPVAGTINRVYISIDTGTISFDNGSSWGNILPAFSGDVSSNVGSTSLTLAVVNSNVGTFGSASSIPIITVNAKGLVTAVSTTAINKSTIGLGNVQNVDTTDASNITSGTLSNSRLTTNLNQLGNITFSTNDFIQYNGTTLTNVTPSTVKTSLSITKADVGLSNVQNVDTTNASNITTGTLPLSVIPAGALERLVVVGNQTARFNLTTATVQNGDTVKQNDTGVLYYVVDDTNLNSNVGYQIYTAGSATSVPYSGVTGIPTNISQLGTITFSTNDIVYYNGTILTSIDPISYKSVLSLTKSDVGLGNVVNSLQVINAGGAVSYAIGTNASRPAAGTAGRQYYSTDQGITYYDNGTTWAAKLPAYTGDVSSTQGGTALTLATVNSNVGTFNNVTVNGKGLVTAASNVAYLTSNQTITLSGDFTGSGTTAITGTLATVNSNVGSFGSTTIVPVITVNGKGLVTAVSTAALTSSSVGLGNVVNSLQVINAGGAVSYALGTNAAKPAAGTAGRQYYSTDQGITYYDNGTTWAAKLPAYSGDVTSTLGGTTLTLATVNSNVGTFNNVTVNGKGLVTAASNVNYLGDSGANGVVVRTALNTTVSRTITGTPNQISITNGNGVANNPTISIADNPVIPGTASMTMPSGTTAQRDTPTNGQMRYNTTLGMAEISDNGVYRPFGKVAQIITGNIPQTTGTTILPYDTTAPTNTEGFEIFSTTITPTYNNSNIVVIFNVYAECSSATNTIVMSLYNDTTSISVVAARPGIANVGSCLGITKNFVSATTAPITLSARVGPSAASTVYLNRGNTETMGSLTTSYIIMEIV